MYQQILFNGIQLTKIYFLTSSVNHQLTSDLLSKKIFLGLNSKNLTMTKDFFSQNKEIVYWRFEVFYFFQTEIINQSFDIQLNQAPEKGVCSVNPANGTTLTLFTIHCSNWSDEDRVKDYTYYG